MRKILGIISLIVLASCSSFENINLFKGNTSGIKLGTPALTYNGGDLTNEKWMGDGLEVGTSDQTIQVEKVASAKKTFFYADLSGLDFRGNLAITVRAKFVGSDDAKLKLELVDNKGTVTNGRNLTNKVEANGDFKDYIYRLDGSFLQTHPVVKDVNGAYITKAKIYLDQLGTLEVESIKVSLGSETIKQNTKGAPGEVGGVIADFSRGSIKGWQASGAGLSVEKEDGALLMTADAIGPYYQSVSKKIALLSLKGITKIRVRAKIQSDQLPFMRLDLVDINGVVTNKYPAKVDLDGKGVSANDEGFEEVKKDDETLAPINITGESGYADYVFDFAGRYKQSYPTQVPLDEERIDKVIIYINPGFFEFSGKVYIQKIEAITE